MKYFLVLIFLFAVLLICSTCKKEHTDKYCPSDKTALMLNENDIKWLEFSARDSIGYEDSLGNTIHFSKVDSLDELRTDQRCDNLVYELKAVTYMNSSSCPPSANFRINHKHNLVLYNQINNSFPYDTLECFISFGVFNIHGNNSCVSDLNFNADATVITFDSVDIRNRRFYSVYKFKSTGASVMDFYFTKQEGIVAFYDHDSVLWVQNP